MTNINDLFKKIRTRPVGPPKPSAARDWRIIVISFFVVSVALLCYGLYLFYVENSGALFVSIEGGPQHVETLDRDTLQKLIEIFEKKQQTFDNLKVAPLTVTDPSL